MAEEKKTDKTTEHHAKVISFINMKGGVGKTTLCIGLGVCMSEESKVLIIDADPQFNATQSLIDDYKKKETEDIKRDELKKQKKNHPEWTIDNIDDSEFNFYNKEILRDDKIDKKTIFRLFRPQADINERFKVPKPSDLITPLKKNLDLLSGDLSLVLANTSGVYALIKRISIFINKNNLKNKYDYILIDCPPTITIYTNSALLASDYYIIPNRIDRYSIVGIESLQKSVDNLIDNEDKNLNCLGIIYTMVPSNMPLKQKSIKDNFESKKIVNDLDKFDSVLYENKAIQTGKSGTNPMSYKLSKESIEAIYSELKIRLNQI